MSTPLIIIRLAAGLWTEIDWGLPSLFVPRQM